MKTPKIILCAGAITAFSLGLAFGQTGQQGTNNAQGAQQSNATEAGSNSSQTGQTSRRTPAEIGIGQPGTVYQGESATAQPAEPLTRQERLRQEALAEEDAPTSPHLEEVERQVERTRERLREQQARQQERATTQREQSARTFGAPPVIGVPETTDPDRPATEFGSPQSRAEDELDQEMLDESGPVFPDSDEESALRDEDRTVEDETTTDDPLSRVPPRANVPDDDERPGLNPTRPAADPQDDRFPPQRQQSRALDRQRVEPGIEGDAREFGTRQGNRELPRNLPSSSETRSAPATDSDTSRGSDSGNSTSGSSGTSGSSSSGSGGSSSSGGSSGGS